MITFKAEYEIVLPQAAVSLSYALPRYTKELVADVLTEAFISLEGLDGEDSRVAPGVLGQVKDKVRKRILEGIPSGGTRIRRLHSRCVYVEALNRWVAMALNPAAGEVVAQQGGVEPTKYHGGRGK